jgi:hypothetical protein
VRHGEIMPTQYLGGARALEGTLPQNAKIAVITKSGPGRRRMTSEFLQPLPNPSLRVLFGCGLQV